MKLSQLSTLPVLSLSLAGAIAQTPGTGRMNTSPTQSNPDTEQATRDRQWENAITGLARVVLSHAQYRNWSREREARKVPSEQETAQPTIA